MNIYQVKELVWTYLLPAVCLFGLLTNAVSFRVFAHRRRMHLRNRMHQYFQFDSAVEFAYLLICLAYFGAKSSFCAPLRHTYAVVFYEKYVYFYLSTSLAFLMIFLRVFVSVKRFLVAANSGILLKTEHFYQVIGAFACVALVIDLPTIYNIAIVPRQTSGNATNAGSGFELSYKGVESSTTVKTLNFLTYSMRGLVAPAVLFLLNVSTLKVLDRKLAPRIRVTDTVVERQPGQPLGVQAKKLLGLRKNLTKMIIAMNFLFIVGNFSTFVTRTLGVVLTKASWFYQLSVICSNLLLFSSHSAGIFVYYNYDQLYADVLNDQTKRLRTRLHCRKQKPAAVML